MADAKPPEVTSAPPLNGELTAEERKERLATIRRRMTLSTLSVEPPPGWVCRWARHTDSQDIARLEYKGYQIVKDNPKQPRYKTAITCREDGTYTVGDVILVEIPKEIWEFLREEENERANMMVQSAQNDFLSEAAKANVPTFERDAKGRIVKEHR